MENKLNLLAQLKKEKNAVILAHYYTDDDVQRAADYVGDSYFLSEKARDVKEKIIVMCGVSFMGESVKLLNPDKIVLLPDSEADCPMAHMASVEKIKEVREKYEDVAVVCYVNSTAELKAHSDVCVTSANALKIVKNLPNKNIFFIPDKNLAHYVSTKVPDKNFIFNNGHCYIHNSVTIDEVKNTKEKYPEAEILVHPECQKEIVEMADYIGSTSGIIKYASESLAQEFIICTEEGVIYELKEKNPNKKFYLPKENFKCIGMKKITLDKIIKALETNEPQVHLKKELIKEANKPLENMLKMAK
ncbi:quinolinate synthase NadA [Fusobacterium perfoetens]|uniref:quinolinate synthase NadA n=1 Tax=Fusobacterium perfoetens TaxID=852 RepID=UPI001F3AAD5A|nr:quinolinate synthase NadA [Fusobacterium perfoetens]MCF2625124.1 quinolinate synthase NadA [Fusobacterium perfoetens]